MATSNIPDGQMFIQFPQPIAELQDTPKPRVWVKVPHDIEGMDKAGISLFVDNEAMAGVSVGAVRQLGIMDKWLITDTYYDECVKSGRFVPIEDLREVEKICLERGYEMPEGRYLF